MATGEDISAQESPSPAEEPVKRRRGRPKGLPKTGGRKKATRNWTAPEIRAYIMENSSAIETLIDIAAGKEFRTSGPTGKSYLAHPALGERLRAIELLLKKCLPDLSAIEATGAEGSPLIPSPAEQDPRQIGRAILQVLGSAVLDDAPASEPMPTATHMMSTTRVEEIDPVAALDLSDPPAVGERILVGSVGCWIELCPDKRWRAMHADGSLHRYFKDRAEAERQAAELRW